MGRVAGKRAFITGAGSSEGQGACFARMLAAEGAKVCVSDLNPDGARDVANAINDISPGAACSIALDVCDREQWEVALRHAAEFMGGIDVLIHNAAVAFWGNIEDETQQNWRTTMAVDVDALFIGTQVAMPFLKESQPASIITISSLAGLLPSAEFIGYNTAKTAAWMMTKSIALHCTKMGYNIRANSIHPHFVRTPMLAPLIEIAGGGEVGEAALAKQIPLGRILEPEDVGYAVLYLASDESRLVTAAEFKVDGGGSAAGSGASA